MTPEQWRTHQSQMEIIYGSILILSKVKPGTSTFDYFMKEFRKLGNV